MNNDQLERALEFWKWNPVEFVKDVFGTTPEDYQGDILQLLRPDYPDRGAAKSAHGVGKTCVHAWMGWCFLTTRLNARVAATAPTFPQLKDVLWPEYAKWHTQMPEFFRSQWDISEGHIRNKAAPKSWFATARTSSRPENMQGFHGKHILIQVDEASVVPQAVFEVIEGALSNADLQGEEALLFMAGNPNFTSGEFFDAFHKNAELYHRVTISGDAETQFTKHCGRTYVSKRVTSRYRDIVKQKYGSGGAVYDVRVRGLFPKLDDWAVIPMQYAERAQYVPLPDFDTVNDPWILVMDVARGGGDKTTLGYFRRGHCLDLKWWAKTSGTQAEDIVIDAIRELKGRGEVFSHIIIDEPGVGGFLIDNLRRRGVNVVAYNGGQTMKRSVDPEEDCRMFQHRRSRDYWHARRLFEAGRVHIPMCEELVGELACLRYGYNKIEKIQVEIKDEVKRRLGSNASPDLADTIIMGLAPWHSFTNAAIPSILDGDVLEGEVRPTAESRHEMGDLW